MTPDRRPAPSRFQALKFLGGPTILFYALPWLMLLLTLGTLAQREAGLYEARHLYFSAWILWLGPLPLPGAYLTIGAIAVSLLIKFLFYSQWSFRQSGVVLTHLGILILLIGGMLTALTQREGYIAFREGERADTVSDYHARMLAVEKDSAPFAAIPFAALKGSLGKDLPFSVQILETCDNCRPAPVRNAENRRGFAERVALFSAPPEKEDEANLSGVTFRITGAGAAQDGIYAMMEEIPHRPQIESGDSLYSFSLGRAQRELPFDIALRDFRRDVYPGTDMARGFASDVTVTDGSGTWPATISMNEPLRTHGYTLYQSSFSIRPDGEYSILSVVENKGRIFPYLASAVIFAGLLLHILIRLKTGRIGA